MAEQSVQNELSLISKGLYRIVDDVIGPECIVNLRRQLWDVRDYLQNCDTSDPMIIITSGSMSEGFFFQSSDLDIMYLDRNALVCTSSNSLCVHNFQPSSLFRMANEECSVGFTLLECLTCDKTNKRVFSALFRKGQNMYLSSKVIRESFMSTRTSETHGPCQSFNHGLETDHAYTLRCPFWPKQAISFVIRSIARYWPSYDVLKNICNDGCLFVPINSKHQTCSELINLEWRMSFSLAEKKLIYSMNQCQFLCYGLTKLFLNEVVKRHSCINDLLCSYFMKTAVFWEIHECSQNWSLETFLFKFWNVFRRLIKWVSDGYCPNFFIPENNMFFGKICGENQRRLLSVLRDLYSDGYWCLLRCPSLNVNLRKIITQPDITEMWLFNVEEYVPESYIEITKLAILMQFASPVPVDFPSILTIISNTLDIKTESEVMLCTVRLRINYLMQQYAESLLMSVKPPYGYSTSNRKKYHISKSAPRVILRTNTYLCKNYLYFAKYTYMTGNYHETIDILHFIKHRLQSKPYMYIWNLDEDIIMSIRQQGMPYDILIKSYIVDNVEMKSDRLIEELQLESLAIGEYNGSSLLFIPPIVFINFLLILSYTRLGDYQRAYDILEELQILVHNDDGHHIERFHKPTSWEILGICYQICCNREAAFQSYINALNENFNYFKQATEIRIRSLYN